MENPPDGPAAIRWQLPLTAVFRDRAFVWLYLVMFSGLAAGFAVNANMKELVGSASVQAGVEAVAAFALANAAGRIIWGWLFSANIPAAISPILAGVVSDRLGSFTPVLWGIGVLLGCGALALGVGVRLEPKP